MQAVTSWSGMLVVAFNAAGALIVLRAMAEASWLGRAGLLPPFDTVLLLLWPFELWACSVAASHRLSASGRVHAALSTALLPFLAFACEAVFARGAGVPGSG